MSRSFQLSKGIPIEPRFEIFNLLNTDAISAFRSVSYGTPPTFSRRRCRRPASSASACR